MTDSTPLVSVIVPAYNDASYLGTSLDSLRAQSFSDFEVVISDDGSTDSSTEIGERFASKDTRFRLERNPENLGMTRNWNAALKKTRGRYVAKLDADDAFQSDSLKEMVSAIERHPAAAAVFCRTISCDADLRPIGSYRGERALVLNGAEPLAERVENGYFWYRMAFDDYQLWHSNAFLIERDWFIRKGGWDERWGCASDTDFILRVLEENRPVVHCPYPGVLYRQRRGSVSDKYRAKNWLKAEGATIHLLSLARYAASGGEIRGRLSRNRVRLWKNWRECARTSADFPGAQVILDAGRERGFRPTLGTMTQERIRQVAKSFATRILS